MESTGCLRVLLAAILVLGFALPSVASAAEEVAPVRLDPEETQRLGWDPQSLDAVLAHADSLGTDTLIIATGERIVVTHGNPAIRYNIHSARKAMLSLLVGQHLGQGDREIDLDTNLADLGIDDVPIPLTSLQKQATVLHLLRSVSGINHPAAAGEGQTAEKDRRLGKGENQPGSLWAYNNWDYNALTTIFEERTGQSVAEAFLTGVAEPLGLRDFSLDSVSYIEAPALSQHRAAMFSLSGRDLVRIGTLYLKRGELDGLRLLPSAWVDRITDDYTETGEGSLSHGHGYLWWIPGPETGLPDGSYFALGIGRQTLFVVPDWDTVIVHQADTKAFWQKAIALANNTGMDPGEAIEKVALSCLEPSERATEFCREDRLILRREFNRLIELIVAARL